MKNTEHIISDNRDKVIAFNLIADLPEDGSHEVIIQKIVKHRTCQQNRAIFKYFRLIASALQESGYTLRTFTGTLKEGFEVAVTMEAVRAVAEQVSEDMFSKPIKDLSTVEIQELYETINAGFGQSMGVSLPFPSDELPPYGE